MPLQAHIQPEIPEINRHITPDQANHLIHNVTVACDNYGHDLDDLHSEILHRFHGWFVHKGGSHIAIHRASGEPRLLLITLA